MISGTIWYEFREAAERTGAVAESQARGVVQKARRGEVAKVCRRGRREAGILRLLAVEG
jgi:hypothetical protein